MLIESPSQMHITANLRQTLIASTRQPCRRQQQAMQQYAQQQQERKKMKPKSELLIPMGISMPDVQQSNHPQMEPLKSQIQALEQRQLQPSQSASQSQALQHELHGLKKQLSELELKHLIPTGLAMGVSPEHIVQHADNNGNDVNQIRAEERAKTEAALAEVERLKQELALSKAM
jgi:hypothetical protein